MEVEYTLEQIKEMEAKAAEAELLRVELDKAKADVNSTVEELKELRKKKQDAEDLLKAQGKLSTDVDPVQKAREAAMAVLNEEKSKQIEMTRQEFENNFKISNPEFLPSNDVGGLKFAAFKKVLDRFNLSSVTNVNELKTIYGDALTIMNGTTYKPRTESNPYAFSPASRGSVQDAPENDLSPREQKLIESVGWTKEKYLKLKVRQPGFIAGLIAQVKD